MSPALWFVPALLCAAPPPQDLTALLARVGPRVDRQSEFQRRATFRERSRVEELDSDGKVTRTTLTEATVQHVDGKPVRTLVRATRDGKDVTEELRKKREKKDKDQVQLESPLATRQQPRHRFTLLPSDSPATLRVAFEPAGDDVEGCARGEALLDAATAHVLRMKLAPAKLPRFADQADSEVVFGAATPAGPMPSRIEIRAAGGFLLVRSRFHVVTELSDYAVPVAPPGD